MNSQLHTLLTEQRDSILSQAVAAVVRAQLPHYQMTEVVQARLARLFDLANEAIETRNLGPVLEHSRQLAEDRFFSGHDLSEVQTAINVLEESMWKHVVGLLPPESLSQALGLCSTVLGEAKDCLARTYVSLASHSHAPSLNLQSLFEGVAR